DAPQGEMPKGVANLFDLLERFGSADLVDRFKKEYNDNTIKYSELKNVLAQAISDYFSKMRETKKTINQDQITKILQDGAKKAATTANQTLAEVKEKIGLI